MTIQEEWSGNGTVALNGSNGIGEDKSGMMISSVLRTRQPMRVV